MPIFGLAVLVALAFIGLQLAAIPRQRTRARSIELTARWSDPDEAQLEPPAIICDFAVPGDLRTFASVPVFQQRDWLPQMAIELEDFRCDGGPAFLIGSEQAD